MSLSLLLVMSRLLKVWTCDLFLECLINLIYRKKGLYYRLSRELLSRKGSVQESYQWIRKERSRNCLSPKCVFTCCSLIVRLCIKFLDSLSITSICFDLPSPKIPWLLTEHLLTALQCAHLSKASHKFFGHYLDI